MQSPQKMIYVFLSFILSGCGLVANPTASPMPAIPMISPSVSVTLTIPNTPTIQISTATLVPVMSSSPTLFVETATFTAIPPSTTPQPTACQSPKNWTVYTVQRGDTLYLLSQSTGVDWRQIQTANCLSGTVIFAGQPLYLPFIPAPTVAYSFQPDTNQVSPTPPSPPMSPTPPPPGPGNPKLIITPKFGPPGTEFGVAIEGFPAGKTIVLKIIQADSVDGKVIAEATLVADANGKATATLAYFTALGSYIVYASTIDPPVSKTGDFTVINHPTNTP
jgi:LysM repeat protein